MGLFTGKTVIVTGGGKATLKDGSAGSIGYGIDIAFAKEGANLVITGRNVAKLEAAKESLEAEYGVKVLPVQADVSAGQDNEAVVQNVIDKAIEEFGRIDAVVNNAQASASGVTIADHTMDQFNLAIYSGLYATYLYMQKAYPHLKETKGSVVNFASGAGLFGNYGQCSYAAAKEGIRGLTLSNAMHLSSWLGKPVDLPFDEDLFLAELNRRRATSRKKESKDITFSTEGTY